VGPRAGLDAISVVLKTLSSVPSLSLFGLIKQVTGIKVPRYRDTFEDEKRCTIFYPPKSFEIEMDHLMDVK
jgi:hypothetical protein